MMLLGARAPIRPRSASTLLKPRGMTTRLGSVDQARVAVISTTACPYCKAAKRGLGEAGIDYVEVDVSHGEQQALRARVKEVTGSKTVPQIFVKGRSIGGSDVLAAMLADGSFRSLLDAAPQGPALPPELLEGAQQAQVDAGRRHSAQGASRELPELLSKIVAAGILPSTEARLGGGIAKTMRSFSGRGLVDSLSQVGGCNRDAALRQAQSLLEANLISSIPAAAASVPSEKPLEDSATSSYFIVSEAPNPEPGQALNAHFSWYGPARPALQVSLDLRQLILELYERHLSPDGRSVSYKQLGSDPLFRRYVDAAAELQKVDIAPLSAPELTAFFINLYNALIVHALVVQGTEMSAMQRARFFSSSKYCIGGLQYSADDMENGVLRGNRPAASNLWAILGLHRFSAGQFPDKSDPRRAKVVEEVDPRIHFALVCGAKSCPPIKLYTPENLEEALDSAGEAFCSGEVQVDKQRNEVRLSKIFKWYAIDFGSNAVDRLKTILPFLKGGARADLGEMLGKSDRGQSIKISFREYDWGLNGE